MKKYTLSLCILAATLSLYACSDDSSSIKVSNDESGCDENCQNCVNDKCLDQTDPGKDNPPKEDPKKKTCSPSCDKNQVCNNGKCVADLENHSCAHCADDETCVNAACVKISEACANCGDNTVCVGGFCYPEHNSSFSGCLNCAADEVCRDNECFKSTSFCATCAFDESCVDGKQCVPADPCNACSADQKCVDGACVECPNTICGGVCCKPYQACDLVTGKCSNLGDDGAPLCNGEECKGNLQCAVDKGHCDQNCTDGRESCGKARECCQEGYACNEAGYCQIVCQDDDVMCGEARKEYCCSSSTPVCGDNRCLIACDESSHTRCGQNLEYCCDNASEVCVFNKCVKPSSSNSCTTERDCDYWSLCDQASHRCISTDEIKASEVCTYTPPVGEFKPRIKWQYKIPTSEANGIVQTPIVINLTDDGIKDGKIDQNDIPDIVFIDNKYTLTAISGDDGHLLARTSTSGSGRIMFNRHNEAGAADIDGDGEIEVLAPAISTTLSSAKLYAMVLRKNGTNYEWVEKYKIDPPSGANFGHGDGGAGDTYWSDYHPTIADIDSDGEPDIITTVGIIRGKHWDEKWKCTYNMRRVSTWYMSFFSVADLDQDGNMEIINTDIYDNNCKIIADHTKASQTMNADGTGNNQEYDYVAVANLIPNDNDPNRPGELIPEIVKVRSGYVSVWKVYRNGDNWTQRMVWEEKQTSTKGGGNPVIADFDGDGDPDIGVAGEKAYSVFNGQDGSLVWASKTKDESSHKTGSSVFDFEGDGVAEVIYRDEQNIRIYSGKPDTGKTVKLDNGGTYTAGKILWESPNTSGTVIENPVIVDVDNDGRTEIVVVDEGTPSNGITVYADSLDNWVRTRRIWNQHAYHVTNINEDGTVPKREEANWLNKHLNNYRANVQPSVNFAPDFVAGDFSFDNKSGCAKTAGEQSTVGLTATILNNGSLSVSAKVAASFYVKDYVYTDGNTYTAYLGTAYAEPPIAAGGSATATYAWDGTGTIMVGGTATKVSISADKYQVMFSVDDAHGDDNYVSFHECHEDNNNSSSYKVEACEAHVF